jgi:hypothetical protein
LESKADEGFGSGVCEVGSGTGIWDVVGVGFESGVASGNGRDDVIEVGLRLGSEISCENEGRGSRGEGGLTKDSSSGGEIGN